MQTPPPPTPRDRPHPGYATLGEWNNPALKERINKAQRDTQPETLAFVETLERLAEDYVTAAEGPPQRDEAGQPLRSPFEAACILIGGIKNTLRMKNRIPGMTEEAAQRLSRLKNKIKILLREEHRDTIEDEVCYVPAHGK